MWPPSFDQIWRALIERHGLKGATIPRDQKREKQPYLNQEQAALIEEVVDKYEALSGMTPTRIVVHKTSMYQPEEELSVPKSICPRSPKINPYKWHRKAAVSIQGCLKNFEVAGSMTPKVCPRRLIASGNCPIHLTCDAPHNSGGRVTPPASWGGSPRLPSGCSTVVNDEVMRVLKQQFGKQNVIPLPEVCVVRVRYPRTDVLQSMILTWPQAKYVADHPQLTNENLVDGHLPGDWPE